MQHHEEARQVKKPEQEAERKLKQHVPGLGWEQACSHELELSKVYEEQKQWTGWLFLE